jgi:lipopolysaccharide-induced tumor necrosis factor-alpha factor
MDSSDPETSSATASAPPPAYDLGNYVHLTHDSRPPTPYGQTGNYEQQTTDGRPSTPYNEQPGNYGQPRSFIQLIHDSRPSTPNNGQQTHDRQYTFNGQPGNHGQLTPNGHPTSHGHTGPYGQQTPDNSRPSTPHGHLGSNGHPTPYGQPGSYVQHSFDEQTTSNNDGQSTLGGDATMYPPAGPNVQYTYSITTGPYSYSEPVVTVQSTRAAYVTKQTFGDVPVRIICPSCQEEVLSHVSYVTGGLAWTICGILFGLGFLTFLTWFICYIPFLLNNCKDVVHKCPSCKSVMGRKNRC